jgi:hypothetical protein
MYSYFQRLLEMLTRCPRLEELHLSLWHRGTLDYHHFFNQMMWPALKKLTLCGLYFHGPSSIVDNFVQNHPALETLYIGNQWMEPGQTWPEKVPNLRAAHGGLTWSPSAGCIPETLIKLQNLEFLSDIDLSTEPDRLHHFEILAQIPNLRFLVVNVGFQRQQLTQRWFEGFLKAVPRIERLHCLQHSGSSTAITASWIYNDKNEASNFLILGDHYLQ